MYGHGLGELGQSIAGPRRGYGLFARIGPGVGVMEVDHDTETHRGGPGGHLDHIRFIAPSSRGIYPNPQTDGIDTFTLQDSQAVLLYPSVVEELDALGFHLGQPSHVGTIGEYR